ncbi:hypothetical protein M8J77_012054 [Diaphorina citri]|nr:hypothetical protein M8J77_012054 [Diaphorina citri]
MTDRNIPTALSTGHPLSGDRVRRISPLSVTEIPDMEGAQASRTSAGSASDGDPITQSFQHRNTYLNLSGYSFLYQTSQKRRRLSSISIYIASNPGTLNASKFPSYDSSYAASCMVCIQMGDHDHQSRSAGFSWLVKEWRVKGH